MTVAIAVAQMSMVPVMGKVTWTPRTEMTQAADSQPTAKRDAELMRRVSAGESAASREVVELYLDQIVAYAFKMLRDAAEAEDVAQEAYLRLWRNADRWRPEAPVVNWLHKVTYNLCIDRLRKKSTVNLENVSEPADVGPSPAKALHQTQIAEAVAAAIEDLPERQRFAIVLVHQQEMSNIETAAIMEISIDAVESLLARGRRGLKKALVTLRPDLEGEI